MPGINRRYPHLLQQDINVWLRYLAEHETDYSVIDYDVRVGVGRDPGPSYTPNLRQMGIDLSRRRIDAVGYTADQLDIIEITTAAGLTCIGQLTTYAVLYRQTYKYSGPIRTLLVCSSLLTDVQPGLDAAGIVWLVYPDAATT